ncbi:unnamed protein product [Owenia fusiformis]|uniref:Short-chain dehydrogenase/reductase 3 n=1 Tax=Owenia fusiformis TaxID=6347 RepID=A0A8J1U852_OWEFU|nr:unnamed protein product [Owenia fusiformis]CAH1773637.1 unnamed protein product [Owenia fusiformis]
MNVIFEFILVLLNIGFSCLENFISLFIPPKRKDITNEIALVTGGGHGIGREMALELATNGAKVILWDINTEGVKETAAEINQNGGFARAYKCDVSNVDEVNQTAAKVKQEVGDVTMLLNNAGILYGLNLMRLTDEQIKRIWNVNCLAHFWTVRAFLPKMIENNHGHILTLASASAISGTAFLVDYSATKWAVDGFTDALDEEIDKLGCDGVHTTTVYPLFVNTGMTWYPRDRFGRVFEPREVAEAAIDGMLRNRHYVHVPRINSFTRAMGGFLPKKAYRALKKYCDLGIDLQVKNKDD